LKHKLKFFNSRLEELESLHLFRKIQTVKLEGPHIIINKKKLVNLGSNDYLGLATRKIQTTQLQSSSRLVSGNDVNFSKLEKSLAKHKFQEKSLIFPTGYMANIGVISAISGEHDLILSDQLNHASIVEGCKLSGAKTKVYNHNDMDDLRRKIKNPAKRKFIVTEGIFSMDGDFANLKQIAEIAETHDAIVLLDDAHGDFVVGTDGKGSANYQGVSKKIDFYISSLSKGLGSFGGYVASEKNAINFCVNKAKSFIFTSALPTFLVEHALSKFHSNREKQRKKLEKNKEFLLTGLKKLGFNINSTTQIIPIIIGEEKKAMEFGRYLFKEGIFSQPIRYPTVEKNKARIRISVTAWLNHNHLEHILRAFETTGKKSKII